jgi:cysteine sulfinate desulfinase/cysteine desulfurase-like protein
MDVPTGWAKGTLRLTTGRMTTPEEVDRAAAVIVAAVREFREIQKEI